MKKFFVFLAAFALLFACSACGSTSDGAEQTETKPTAETETETAVETAPETDPADTEEPDMSKIEIIIADQAFSATLYDNETAKALYGMLPMTLSMSELNGNEKYYYLDDSLPAAPSKPDGIRAGDLMLYGDDCLVLFYESFSTAYRYTPIGYAEDPEGLAAALGDGGVTVTFKK